jgi:hypothetical protein
MKKWDGSMEKWQAIVNESYNTMHFPLEKCVKQMFKDLKLLN